MHHHPTHSPPRPASPPDVLLREMLVDAVALDRAGRWGEALDRCRQALREYQQHAASAIGAGVTVDLLAADVARMIGADVGLVRAAAREVLIDSPAAAVARELRTMRRERRAQR